MDKYWGDWNIKHTFLTNQKNRPFGLENVKQECDYFQFKLNFSIVGAYFSIKSGEDVLFPILARIV